MRQRQARETLLPSTTRCRSVFLFFFNDTATTEIYTLSLHDALPIYCGFGTRDSGLGIRGSGLEIKRSEEHTSELQSLRHLVCRLLLEKKHHKPPSHRCVVLSPRRPTPDPGRIRT